jgi:F-type H+-transporting ATPase subunit b
MRRLLLAFSLLAGLVVLAPRAHAQDSAPDTTSGNDHAAAVDDDPSQHFNFADHWFDYRHLDSTGDKLGNGQVKGEGGQLVHSDDEEPMSPPFALYLLDFLIFYWLLIKYLWPAGKKLARERHDQIKTALDEAAALREQAQKKLAEYEARIKDVDAEVKKIVDDIRAAADEDKKRILENAERQAKQMKHDAELRIAAEIEMARHQLAKEVAAAAATATEKLLKDKTTPDDQKKLVGNFISGMGA